MDTNLVITLDCRVTAHNNGGPSTTSRVEAGHTLVNRLQLSSLPHVARLARLLNLVVIRETRANQPKPIFPGRNLLDLQSKFLEGGSPVVQLARVNVDLISVVAGEETATTQGMRSEPRCGPERRASLPSAWKSVASPCQND